MSTRHSPSGAADVMEKDWRARVGVHVPAAEPEHRLLHGGRAASFLFCAAGAGGCLLAAGFAYGWSGLRTAVGIAATMALYALIVRVFLVLRWPTRLAVLLALGWVPGVAFGLVVGSVTDRLVALLGLATGLLGLEALVHHHDRP